MTSEDRAEVSRMIEAAMARMKKSMLIDPARAQARIAELVGGRGPELYIPTVPKGPIGNG